MDTIILPFRCDNSIYNLSTPCNHGSHVLLLLQHPGGSAYQYVLEDQHPRGWCSWSCSLSHIRVWLSRSDFLTLNTPDHVEQTVPEKTHPQSGHSRICPGFPFNHGSDLFISGILAKKFSLHRRNLGLK